MMITQRGVAAWAVTTRPPLTLSVGLGSTWTPTPARKMRKQSWCLVISVRPTSQCTSRELARTSRTWKAHWKTRRNLYDAATQLNPDTAVVLCLCYNTPNSIPRAGVRTLLPGDRGYRDTRALVDSLGLTDRQNVTLSGHSFGAVIAYRLLGDGHGDIAVLAGPAPLGPSPSPLLTEDVYWGFGGEDLLRFVPGNKFISYDYIEDGGNQFRVDATAGHDDYYETESMSLLQMAALVVGNLP